MNLKDQAAALQKRYKFISPKNWSANELNSLVNDFTFHTSKLEGLKLSYGDTLEYLKYGLIKKKSDLKDIADLENHKNLLLKIFNTYDSLELSVEMIKDLHSELMKDDIQWTTKNAYSGGPGEFKRENNFGTRKNGEFKEYMDWMNVPKALENLCVTTKERMDNPSDVLPAINNFHFEFANNIHPFGDGNGRMARLVHNLLLLQNKYPIIVIEDHEKEVYLDAIVSQEKTGEMNLDKFLTKKVIIQMGKKLNKSKGMSMGM